MESLAVLKEAATAAYDKKAGRIVAMDLRGASDICDYTLICSGENEKQVQAIATSVETRLRDQFRLKPSGTEGMATGQWVLLDYGHLIVHVFLSALRDAYAIEELWPQAKFLKVIEQAEAAPASPKAQAPTPSRPPSLEELRLKMQRKLKRSPN